MIMTAPDLAAPPQEAVGPSVPTPSHTFLGHMHVNIGEGGFNFDP